MGGKMKSSRDISNSFESDRDVEWLPCKRHHDGEEFTYTIVQKGDRIINHLPERDIVIPLYVGEVVIQFGECCGRFNTRQGLSYYDIPCPFENDFDRETAQMSV